MTVFGRPSNNTNGNSFEGRLLSCEDFMRLLRGEHDGTMSVIAASYESKPLNSPNGVAAHPGGSVWFTDSVYSDQLAEGDPDEAGGPTNPQGILNPHIGAPDAGVIGGKKRELPGNTYRWDPSGKLEVVVSEEEVPDPNGLCFFARSQDLLLDQHRQGAGRYRTGGQRVIYALDIQGTKVANKRLFTDMTVDGVKCGPDDMCADVLGNLWCSTAPG